MITGKNLLKAQIMHKKTKFDLRVREDMTIEDLKYQIERHENLTMAYYYLFFDNLNLLDIYNSYTLARIIEITTNSPPNTEEDYIFYLTGREEYKEIVNQLNCLRCEVHSYNTAYLFCSKCNLLICDQCKESDHKLHEKVNDQALCLQSYFIKLQQYELKFKSLFNKTKANDLSKICYQMEINLADYMEREKVEITKLADDLKEKIDKIKELEITRLERFGEAGKNKINEFEDEAGLIFKMYKECNEGLQARKQDLEAFSKWKNETKVEYLKKVQNKNAEMIERSVRIEKVLEKFKNVEEYDVYKLLEANKDYSYAMTFTKLNQIFSRKMNKLEEKLKLEKCDLLISRMENMKSRIGTSKVYNRLLNLNSGGSVSIDEIMQPVDLTSTVSIFNIKEKRIRTQDVNFQTNSSVVLNQFPKFSRSINVNGKIYVSGGEVDGVVVNYLIEVNCDTFEARIKKGMDYRRSAHTLVNISNIKLIAISGAYGEKSSETYNIEKNVWNFLSNVRVDRIGACSLIYCSETIFLFFGKRYDSNAKKWEFIDSVERINLYEQYPHWSLLSFKSTSVEIVKNRAFSAIIACPNEKVFIVGGQYWNEGKVELAPDVLEINVESQTIVPTTLSMPRLSSFLENNFYFHNSNAILFDNEGAIILYSVIFNELHQLENF